jgi:hypothetical protein
MTTSALSPMGTSIWDGRAKHSSPINRLELSTKSNLALDTRRSDFELNFNALHLSAGKRMFDS